MHRPRFDPSKMAVKNTGPTVTPSGAEAAAAKPSPALTVSQVATKIDAALRSGLPTTVRVIGEISGLRERTHWYFDLKDADAVVSAVMFASSARKAGFTPENGQEVVVQGRIEFYAKQGKVSLIVERIEPVGAGSLELAFRRLVEEVRSLGWLDPARKRTLPRFPRRVAVVTSRTGAALQDVLVTMRRRCPAVAIAIADVRVQGVGSASEIAAAIDALSRDHDRLGIDAILVTRGGGSKEDLWSFNERDVARAIVSSRVPVVAAIGHETDVTLAELVADERCATPTQAAMRLTPDAAELSRQIDSIGRRLRATLARSMDFASHRIESLADRPAMADPRWIVSTRRERVDDATDRLRSAIDDILRHAAERTRIASAHLERRRPDARRDAMHQRLASATDRLARAAAWRLRLEHERLVASGRELDAVSPQRVIDRGFSVTTTADGRVVRAVRDASPGDRLVTRVGDGRIESTVDSPDRAVPTRRHDQGEFAPARPSDAGQTPPDDGSDREQPGAPTPSRAFDRRSRATGIRSSDQPGLFGTS